MGKKIKIKNVLFEIDDAHFEHQIKYLLVHNHEHTMSHHIGYAVNVMRTHTGLVADIGLETDALTELGVNYLKCFPSIAYYIKEKINGIVTRGTITGLSLSDKPNTDDKILTIGEQLEKGICRYSEDE